MDRDEQLLFLAADGDDDAFATLARRWRPKLEAFAARVLGDPESARDAAQEALVRLWRAAGRYQAEGNLLAYLHTVTRNVCLSRRSRAGHRESGAGVAEPADATAYPEQADTDGDAVRAAVMSLPEHFREVVLLSVYQDLSYAEIAAALGCPLGTVASRKAAAVRLLRAKLAHSLEGDRHDL